MTTKKPPNGSQNFNTNPSLYEYFAGSRKWKSGDPEIKLANQAAALDGIYATSHFNSTTTERIT
jgi:hypothetical protein